MDRRARRGRRPGLSAGPAPHLTGAHAGEVALTLFHFQAIAHWGACGKTRGVPQNRWPRPEAAEEESHGMRVLSSTTRSRGVTSPRSDLMP
ncbi:hypothetical protein; putative signal peptide [Frankia alni ACN14a]|uniref:Uncharacterized protein n=1 Tax=Frankia alni (strain DSM 45986 / CECT 9034 / ACN14a) TaxID=326424 RepID=Q0RGD7_FRAAA|nr:hypothetical protein; putative signal peptide [Frankia alni ACN14a]